MTKHVILELNSLELGVIHDGLELLRKEKKIMSLLDDRYVMMLSEDIRNASNDKLMESTILSARIRWSDKDVPSLKSLLTGETLQTRSKS